MLASWRQFFAGWNIRIDWPGRFLAQRDRLFKRYLYRNYRTFASITHRFGRRVTVAGWMVLAGTVAAAALGADTNLSWSYQTFALLGCIVLASAICTPLGRPDLFLERTVPKFGSVGNPLRYQILVRNRSRKPQNALKLIEELPDPRPTFEEFAGTPEPGEERRNWVDRTYGYYRWRWLLARNIGAHILEQPVPDLPPNGECSIAAQLMPLRRGVLRLTGTTVACPDPFGLFRSLRRLPGTQSILILPRRYPMPAFALPGTMKYQSGGVSMASSVGESEEFVALREYRPGDPLRRMHWKSFAKFGEPIVKEHQEEFFVRHALILDTFGGPAGAELFEEAVSVAASLAFTIQNQDSLLDLMFAGTRAYCFTSGRGLGHIEQILEVLASVQVSRDNNVASLEHLVATHAGELSGCVCVFLSWDEQRQRLVNALLSRNVPLRVFVLTHSPDPLPLGVMESQPRHFRVLPIGQVAEKLAAL
ncbi:MAG TPA: DUF58 domain-containing protein [Candidatus Baltobacteraceae bacterium]|jgi:uncharacterized protein (DUF58 family)|nr:DUF58 domain-containing protein [Candidatus Baltobacteraceae bacterium]